MKTEKYLVRFSNVQENHKISLINQLRKLLSLDLKESFDVFKSGEANFGSMDSAIEFYNSMNGMIGVYRVIDIHIEDIIPSYGVAAFIPDHELSSEILEVVHLFKNDDEDYIMLGANNFVKTISRIVFGKDYDRMKIGDKVKEDKISRNSEIISTYTLLTEHI